MDVLIEVLGTIVLFHILTPRARAWVDRHVQSESWQWSGDALAVDHRYAPDLEKGMWNADLEVGV